MWFLSRSRSNGKFRNRREEILFIDARNLGHLINRRTLEFSEEDIAHIAATYHNWRNAPAAVRAPLVGAQQGDHQGRPYEDIPGFCKSAPIERVRELDYVLTPGRYVGLPEEEDDFDFAERFAQLQVELAQQLVEESRLNALIQENLAKVMVPDG